MNEAKLIILGEGNSGKTALAKRLIENTFFNKTKTTEGIYIEKWGFKTAKGEDFRVNIWDFGGQEIYHNTHQFFLTKSSLYLLVWNARADENETTFDYWLNIVKLLSGNSPLLIIQNKIDERLKNIDEIILTKEFKNILGFHKVSALTGEGINDLIPIIKSKICKLEHVGSQLPKVWIRIREELEETDKNYVSKEEYISICLKYGLDEQQSEVFSEHYHRLGVFLNFHDNAILRNIIFLKPEWATRAIYRLLDEKGIIDKYGKFHFNSLSLIWNEYPREKHVIFIELMKKFELCFELPSPLNYIIPDLLSPSEPNYSIIPFDRNPSYVYQYEFMPYGIVTRLIVRLHTLIANNWFWKNGLIVNWKGDNWALIVSEQRKRKISIFLKGNKKQKVLSIIQKEIEDIHRNLNKPTVFEKLPCICEFCVKSSNPYMFESITIENANRANIKDIQCLYSFKKVPINGLINDVKIEEQENEIIKLLESISNKIDDRSTLMQKANDIVQIKPNLMGIGIDVNKIVEIVYKRVRSSK